MRLWLASGALALLMLSGIAMDAAAQATCGGWYATCRSRCKQMQSSNCNDYCSAQLARCRKTGCWTQGAAFGGATHCDLGKR